MLNSYAMCVTTFQLGMDSYLPNLQQLQPKKVQNLHFAQFPCQLPAVTFTTKGETAFSDFLVLEIGYFPLSSVVTVVTCVCNTQVTTCYARGVVRESKL